MFFTKEEKNEQDNSEMIIEQINLYHCLVGYDSVYVTSPHILTSKELCKALNRIIDRRNMQIKCSINSKDDSINFRYLSTGECYAEIHTVHVNRTVIENMVNSK
ncbi:hypothetical protein [Clostridium tarantellae]|uniref:Uncharacterized protein n=1 Tax=Clostridium tarantellae TaxID=39493 RepID=A0A6I1MP81_9CLOT|nr:hypothetical protein [Clostridium tarantellae]MPQ42681.1 hypothetical protein [Clostridium tarantellae]